MNSELLNKKLSIIESIPLQSIEDDMVFIENVISKYYTIDENWMFIYKRREPLIRPREINAYKAHTKIYNQPVHPLYAPSIVSDYIDMIACENNPYQMLIAHNTLLRNNNIKITKIYHYPNSTVLTIEELIYRHIPNISHDDMMVLLKYMEIIYDKIYKIVMCNSSAIYDLNISQVPVVLNIYCDIKSFRFDEAHLNMDNDTDNYDIVRDNYDALYNYGIDDTRVPIKGVI